MFKGNYEVILSVVLNGDYDVLWLWLEYGGCVVLDSLKIDLVLVELDYMCELIMVLEVVIFVV